LATPEAQAIVAARIIRANPSASDWIGSPPVPGRENAEELLAALGPVEAALAQQAHPMTRQTGGLMRGPAAGVRESLSYHHHAEHSILSHMQQGGLLSGLLKGIFGELGITLPEPSHGSMYGTLWEQLTGEQAPERKADGGHIKGVHWPGRDSVPMGVPPGTFIMNRHRSAQYRDILDQMLGAGFAAGGLIPIITEPGERVVPPGAAPAGLLHAMNQGQLMRRAAGGQTGVLQVIYNPPGTQEYYGEAAGYGRVGPGTGQPQYYNADWGGHHGHVHTSFETGPDGQPYGMPVGTNLPGGGKEHPEFASAGFPWVLQLGRQYGVYASTYPGHQEHGGKNHGLDWWPVGKADMSGLSYTPEERDKLRRFASAMVSAGSGQAGATWGSGYSSSATSYGGGYGSIRQRLKAILPPWLSRALGLQQGGQVPGMPAIVPSPSGMLGGNGPDDQVVPGDTQTGVTRVILVDRTRKQDPNLPRQPEPVGPYDPNAPGNAPPSWAEGARVQEGAPGAVKTPFGYFQYPTLENMLGMTREEALTFSEWLRKLSKATEAGATDQTAVDNALGDENAAIIRKNSAQAAYDAELAKVTAGLTGQARDIAIATALGDPSTKLARAQKELTEATDHETQTSKAVTKAKKTQGDNITDQNIADLQKPPWEDKAKGAATTPDQNAAAMGAGLIKGMAQELGFGDVFGKPPWEWGIWKLFAGGASYGLNLLNAIGEAGGAPGSMPSSFPSGTGPAPGGEGAPPAMPGGDQHMPSTTDQPDSAGVYTLPDGSKDTPDAQGGYAKPHGTAEQGWHYDAETKRYYPKDKGPKPPAGADGNQPAPNAPDDPWTKMLGPDEEWHVQDGKHYKYNKKTHQAIPGEVYDDNRQKIPGAGAPSGPGPGGPAPPAPPPQAPPRDTSAEGPPVGGAAIPGWIKSHPEWLQSHQKWAQANPQLIPPGMGGPGQPGGGPAPPPEPPVGLPPQQPGPVRSVGPPGDPRAIPRWSQTPEGQSWLRNNPDWARGHREQLAPGVADTIGLASYQQPVQGGDGSVQLVSAVSPMGGPGFSMDMLMHPARYAMREAMARGDIPGPPWAQSVTPAMAASQPPTNVPPGAQGGPQQANFVSLITNNNGVLQGKEDGSKFITGAQVQRSGWHPSMQNV
jgi:hypothetical protein